MSLARIWTSSLFVRDRRVTYGSLLFPYTTLFRSLVPCRPDRRWHVRRRDRPDSKLRIPSGPPRSSRTRPDVTDSPQRRGRRDRKSTRLNSSHVKISYAVFCLKKKKTNSNECRSIY